MIDGKDIVAFNNLDNVVVKDNGIIDVISKSEKRNLTEVYTDGSYDDHCKYGAYSILKKDQAGNYEEFSFISKSQNSSLIELEAVIKALDLFSGNIRIMTDSQYVRKGITEWMVYWKQNNWYTANGKKAKNIDQWQKLDQLCNNRYIEFEHVKAHSNQFENEYCDLMAKQKRNK
jgi:ribonuclease HI